MCLRINKRNTISAGAPNRPRLRLLGCRLASASYTAATICSSASTRSACSIQPSRRSLTSSAINPSPKLSCARRISITLSSRAPSTRLRTQQIMIEFANGLDRLLQLLIVVQPAANLGNALATHAEFLPKKRLFYAMQGAGFADAGTRPTRVVGYDVETPMDGNRGRGSG